MWSKLFDPTLHQSLPSANRATDAQQFGCLHILSKSFAANVWSMVLHLKVSRRTTNFAMLHQAVAEKRPVCLNVLSRPKDSTCVRNAGSNRGHILGFDS